MSVRCLDRVWQESKQEGTRLLVLLALADRAGDDGFCWPGISEIAQRARIGERQAQYHLRALEKSGEIRTVLNRGRTHSNRYLVTVGLSEKEIAKTVGEKMQQIAPISDGKGATDCTIPKHKRCNPAQEKVQSSALKGAIAIAPEPSITVNEPSFDELVETAEKLEEVAIEKQRRRRQEVQSQQPGPATSPVKALVASFQTVIGYPIPNWGQESKAAKWLVDHGYTAEEVFSCWRTMTADEFWRGKHCGLQNVQKRIGAWKSSRNGSGKKAAGGTMGEIPREE